MVSNGQWSIKHLAQVASSPTFNMIPVAVGKDKHPPLPGWQKFTRENALRYIETDRVKNPIGLGVLTGAPSGIIVVDIDIKDNGMINWRNLVEQNWLPKTFTVLTGTGGLHYYFKYDQKTAGMRNRHFTGWGIDIRGDGGFIIFPGSRHENGKLYYVVDGYNIEPYAPIIASMPDWLVQFINTH